MHPTRRTFLLGGTLTLISLAIPSLEGCARREPFPCSDLYEVENVFDEMSRRIDAIARGRTPDDSFTDVFSIPGFTCTDPDSSGSDFAGTFDIQHKSVTCSITFRYYLSASAHNGGAPTLVIGFDSSKKLPGDPYKHFEISTDLYNGFDRSLLVDFYFDENAEMDSKPVSEDELFNCYKRHLQHDLLEPYFDANPNSIFSLTDCVPIPSFIRVWFMHSYGTQAIQN